MMFFIDGKLVTTQDMPLVVILDETDKKNIANMNPECNVYCQWQKAKQTKEEIEKIVDEAKKLSGVNQSNKVDEEPDLTKQTITLGTEDNPAVSLMKGHVDAETFVRAEMEEGWDSEMSDEDFKQRVESEKDMIEHRYGAPWIDEEKGTQGWKYNLEKDDPDAEPVTIRLW